MSDISAALGDAGGCPVIEHAGRKWKIGHPVQAAKKHLEDLILEAVEEPILATKAARPASFREEWDAHRADKRQGRYATVIGDLWREQAFHPEQGALLFLASLLRCHHPRATTADAVDLVAAEPERVESALMRVLPDFFSALLDPAVEPRDPRLKAVPAEAKAEVVARAREMIAEAVAARRAATPSA